MPALSRGTPWTRIWNEVASHGRWMAFRRRGRSADVPRLGLKLVVLVIGLVALTFALDYLIPSFPGARHVRFWLRMTLFLALFARWIGGSEVPWLRLTGFMAAFMALFTGAMFVVELVLEPVTGRSPW